MSEQLSNHQQIKEEFDALAEKAKAADETIGSKPTDHEGIYNTHYSTSVGTHQGMEVFEKDSQHSKITTAFDGRQIRAHVSEPNILNGGRMIDSHSYEAPAGHTASKTEQGRDGSYTKLYTYDREGNPKKLESTNPFVAKMVAEMALKGVNTKAEQVLKDANERKAA